MQIAIDDATGERGQHLLLEALRKVLDEHGDLRILALGERGAFPSLRLRLLAIVSAGLARHLGRPLEASLLRRAMGAVRGVDVDRDLTRLRA